GRGVGGLLHRAHLRGALGDADVQGARTVPVCNRDPARHGEICPGRSRGAPCHARADAAGRAAVDRRGISGSFRHPARARHDSRVVADRGAKTISSETTFDNDVRDFATLEKVLWRLSEKVSARLKNGELAGGTITLKLKTADFRQRTRSQSIHAPTQLAAKIFAISRDLLAREIDGTAFRLMGTGVSALRMGSQADDTDMLDRRAAHAERAIDDLRKKFGSSAVIRG